MAHFQFGRHFPYNRRAEPIPGTHCFDLQWLACDPMAERLTFQQLHGNERLSALIVDFVDRANVRVIESRGSFGLALEAAESLRVLRDLVGQELEGDKATQLHILGFIDHSHPTTAQLLDDAVVRNGLADHWAEMLGLQVGQVNAGRGFGGV